MDNAELKQALEALRCAVLSEGAPLIERLDGGDDPSVANLAHYMALRHRDLRPLQRELMWRGLSSLGRLEGRVLPTLDAVLAALAALGGEAPANPPPGEVAFFAGEARLEAATDRLFGPPPATRRTRIMATLPTEAAFDAALVDALVTNGMDVARINCAHDDQNIWRHMAGRVRDAAARKGRTVPILMDIAGPKIRTGRVAAKRGREKLGVGDVFRLNAGGAPRLDDAALVAATASLPEIVTRLSVGDRVLYDDGKLEGVVETADADEALVRVVRCRKDGAKLKPEKGLNLPDTALGLSPLTDKDRDDLAAVLGLADMVGYSFVSRPEDIDALEEAIAASGQTRPIGLVAKIELPEAVRNLPELIARAARRRPFGVMIARGDLAAEIGFERLAEMQEEILWICEAASVPAIWATQVLEGLVSDGAPSRGEMTDAAMSVRAECVMLNKGPRQPEAVTVLDGLLTRMEAHMFKKTPTLRALKSW